MRIIVRQHKINLLGDPDMMSTDQIAQGRGTTSRITNPSWGLKKLTSHTWIWEDLKAIKSAQSWGIVTMQSEFQRPNRSFNSWGRTDLARDWWSNRSLSSGRILFRFLTWLRKILDEARGCCIKFCYAPVEASLSSIIDPQKPKWRRWEITH